MFDAASFAGTHARLLSMEAKHGIQTLGFTPPRAYLYMGSAGQCPICSIFHAVQFFIHLAEMRVLRNVEDVGGGNPTGKLR